MRRRLTRLVLLPTCVVVLILSRTRSELVILLLGAAVLAAFSRRRVSVGLILVAFALPAGLAVSQIDNSQITQFLARGESATQLFTLTGRTISWSAALELWQQRPLTGYGYYAGHRFGIDLGPGGPDLSTVDNTWIEALLDVGVIGAIPLAVLVVAALIAPVRAERKPTKAGLMYGLLVVGFAASLVNPSIQTTGYLMVFFGLLVLMPADRVPHASFEGPAENMAGLPESVPWELGSESTSSDVRFQ